MRASYGMRVKSFRRKERREQDVICGAEFKSNRLGLRTASPDGTCD